MNSLGLALIIRYFLHQLYAILLPDSLSDTEKDFQLASLETIFVAVVLFAAKFMRRCSEELFVVGLGGMTHVILMFCAMGFQIKCLSMMYMFTVFVAIGPVLSLCIIVDRETERKKAMTIPLCSLAFCIASLEQLSIPLCCSIVAICFVHLLQLIEGQISLERDLQLLRKLRREQRMRERMERWNEWARRPHQVHHFPRTVTRGLYRNDGQARVHPVHSGGQRRQFYRGFEIVENE